MANQKYSLKAETNDERIGFLQQFGWTVNAEPIEISEVTIPRTFNEVYEKYNEIQKQQGMDGPQCWWTDSRSDGENAVQDVLKTTIRRACGTWDS